MHTQATTISSLSPEYQELKELFPSLGKQPATPDPLPSQPVDGSALLHDITGFIARYLQCSENQRVVLALWVLHTYCYYVAQVTPYLSIQSAGKQSGKTLCLRLLSLLCENPALTTGFTASNLIVRMKHRPVSTILLDECQAIVGSRRSSKAPALRALLAGSFHRGLGYTGAIEDNNVFCPKAFAGTGQLPEDLADRSIPIILRPLESMNGLHRFHLSLAMQEAAPLQERLEDWAEQNLPLLEKLPPCSEQDFPPNLSPRRQDICEPLLQLAHAVGGLWPARLGEALIGIFADEAALQLQPNLQLLADVRDCFAHHGFPERLSTSDLLDWMHSLPSRPWEENGRFSPYHLARMLGVFEIRPRLQRVGSTDPARGYQLEDFKEPWQKHLGGVAPGSEIVNIDKDCNGVVEAHVENRTIEDLRAEYLAVVAELEARKRKLEPLPAKLPEEKSEMPNSEIPNNNAGCNTSL